MAYANLATSLKRLETELTNITRRQPRPQGAFPGFGDGAGKGPGRSHDHKRNPEFVSVIN